MEATVLTFEMMVVLGLLALTVFLFVSEIIRIDLAAILVLVILSADKSAAPASLGRTFHASH